MAFAIPGTSDDIAGRVDLETCHPFFGSVLDADQFVQAAVLPNLPAERERLRVIDFGGGQGLLLDRCINALARRGIECDALVVDANPGFVARALTRGVDAVVGEIAGYSGKPADIVLMRLVLHYNSAPVQQAMLANARRHLAADGVFALQYETGDTMACSLRNRIAGLCADATGSEARFWVEPDRLVSWLHEAGFTGVSVVNEPGYESDVVALLRNAWQRQSDTLSAAGLSEASFYRACTDIVFDSREGPDSGGVHSKDGRLALRTRYPLLCATADSPHTLPLSGGSLNVGC
ncbi:Uncharacterized protein AC509_3491 [Pseudomonas amygdali pv. morsprunorum]|uniref:class I SAM-dependent methyltransferase n=1 Tax=Pseudomonas amygdali TaxID=47877 RepID=UPI0006B899E9|nr:class I SAM-dependent methyltransferase [Pseudomonas amygdali]KPC51995.1 Uncharacterized protein AC509_3491 [Pseudomonas amygdali pv. morsprunorum]